MANIDFDFEWIDPAEAKGPELRATWASLRVLVDDHVVTRVIDTTSRGVRTSIFLPLYPVAEWFATRWWSLLHEVESPRTAEIAYARRHSLRYSGEGFATPALTFRPGGTLVEVSWLPLQLAAAQVEFIEQGTALLQSNSLRDALKNFIQAVVRRLEDNDIQGTLLQEEWASIVDTTRDEAKFCAAAAALGLDPYAVDEESQNSIIEAARDLPPAVLEDFFAAADASTLAHQSRFLRDTLARIRATTVDLPSLKGLRTRGLGREISESRPWEAGYEFARRLRAHLELDGTALPTFEALAEVLGERPDTLVQAISGIDSTELFDVAVDVNASSSPAFAIPLIKKSASLRFSLCRALFEFLSGSDAAAALVTRAHSDRQKRNRAFAAEFLAPSSGLRQRIRGGTLGVEGIEELAEQFGVSSTVIEHQVQNHRLARLEA